MKLLRILEGRGIQDELAEILELEVDRCGTVDAGRGCVGAVVGMARYLDHRGKGRGVESDFSRANSGSLPSVGATGPTAEHPTWAKLDRTGNCSGRMSDRSLWT